MSATLDLHQISARKFLNHCKNKFGWSDLSNDVVMDVGCGEHGWCGKALLELFPDVRTVIGIDKRPTVVRNLNERTPRIECSVADIEKRETLQTYEGKMTKVLSTHTFHQLDEKEKAFQNVYHLLKPGGEAAILFIMKSSIYEWFMKMLKIPKWKAIYQKPYVEDLYKIGVESDYFKEMVAKIGFRVLECADEKIVIPYPSDQVCKDYLYGMSTVNFKLQPEEVEEFKEDAFRIFTEVNPRDAEGRPCYRSTEVFLLLVKPMESSPPEA